MDNICTSTWCMNFQMYLYVLEKYHEQALFSYMIGLYFTAYMNDNTVYTSNRYIFLRFFSLNDDKKQFRSHNWIMKRKRIIDHCFFWLCLCQHNYRCISHHSTINKYFAKQFFKNEYSFPPKDIHEFYLSTFLQIFNDSKHH